MPHLYAAPQHVGFRVWYRTGAIGGFWPYGPGAMQDSGYELRRIYLLKLSEKGYEQRSEHVFGPIRKPKWAEEPLFCGPEGYTLGASETFQTVSEEKFSEVRYSPGPMRQGFLCSVSEVRTRCT